MIALMSLSCTGELEAAAPAASVDEESLPAQKAVVDEESLPAQMAVASADGLEESPPTDVDEEPLPAQMAVTGIERGALRPNASQDRSSLIFDAPFGFDHDLHDPFATPKRTGRFAFGSGTKERVAIDLQQVFDVPLSQPQPGVWDLDDDSPKRACKRLRLDKGERMKIASGWLRWPVTLGNIMQPLET